MTFFKEFHSSEIEPEKFKKIKQKFNNDTDYQNQVTETVTLLNERFLQIEKSKILAKLIISHIEEKLSWNDFVDLTVVLDSINPRGFLFLHNMAKEHSYGNHDRGQDDEALMFACGIGYRHGSLFKITELGKKFYEHGLENFYLTSPFTSSA